MSSDAKKSFPVSKYLSSVKRLVTEQIPAIWVHGVISQLTVRDRMCYLSLSEYLEGDVRPVASLSLYMYSGELEALNEKLEKLPQPFRLGADLKVSLLLQADFYIPQGKFQAKVLDIDPIFTLGELALTRQAILKRLDSEGLRARNRALPMPAVPLRIGLVTAPGSAAYHDFVKTLESSGFAFEVFPAWARMQGNETESTILAALGQLAVVPHLDVVCIVRGGGSKTDLNYFDSEALCRAVALSSVPVLSGIGHEIDQSLVDLVAWQACITPTDTAKILVGRVQSSWDEVCRLVQDVAKLARLRMVRENARFQGVVKGILRGLPGRMMREHQSLDRNALGLKNGSWKILGMAQLGLNPWSGRLKQSIALRKQAASSHLDLLAEKIHAADPMRIVRRGFSITTGSDGKPIRSACDLVEGAELHTRFAWGDVRSRVLK